MSLVVQYALSEAPLQNSYFNDATGGWSATRCFHIYHR